MTGAKKKAARKPTRGVKKPHTDVEPTLVRGPRQERKLGLPNPRLSRHKTRSVWFRSRVTWPMREAPIVKLLRERQRALRTLPPVTPALQWELAGPSNIGGRCTSLVCDPTDPDRVWIGAAGGGVWISQDAGKTWKGQWRSKTVLEIGSLAIDPSNPDVMYCGTGEANLSADSYPGDGVYRSINRGKTWKPWAKVAMTGVPRRIGVIAIDPA